MEFHEIPSKVLAPFAEDDFVFLPISRGEDMDKVAKKLTALRLNGIDFPAGVDPESATWSGRMSNSIPKNFVIDKKGVIRYVPWVIPKVAWTSLLRK